MVTQEGRASRVCSAFDQTAAVALRGRLREGGEPLGVLPARAGRRRLAAGAAPAQRLAANYRRLSGDGGADQRDLIADRLPSACR